MPLSRAAASIAPAAAAPDTPARFAVGDPVRVRDARTCGHTRAPRYVRGKRGIVVRVTPHFVLPDAAGHGHRAPREQTYHVEFAAKELWSNEGGSDESVIVDLWESYLEVPRE